MHECMPAWGWVGGRAGGRGWGREGGRAGSGDLNTFRAPLPNPSRHFHSVLEAWLKVESKLNQRFSKAAEQIGKEPIDSFSSWVC